MFCSSCGRPLEGDLAFCPNCGAPVRPAAPSGVIPPGGTTPSMPATVPGYVPPPLMFPYAGFWLRFVAYVIDSLILGIAAVPIIVLLVLLTGAGAAIANMGNRPEDFVFPAALVTFILLMIPILICGQWLYFAMLESSTRQATLGKMAIGLIVTDMEGKRMTFARATGRYFAKIVTGLVPLAIGWIMAGFTEKKQALHDFIAATLVLKKV